MKMEVGCPSKVADTWQDVGCHCNVTQGKNDQASVGRLDVFESNEDFGDCVWMESNASMYMRHYEVRGTSWVSVWAVSKGLAASKGTARPLKA
jgi:hypothetical protein